MAAIVSGGGTRSATQVVPPTPIAPLPVVDLNGLRRGEVTAPEPSGPDLQAAGQMDVNDVFAHLRQ